MPDWTAPFHRPHMTTAEFEKKKAEYNAKYGYTITLPGLSDIIHLGFEKKMTAQETKDWKARKYDQFSTERLDEIRKMKQKRKEKYLAMLGSPTPHVVRTAGSILTSIDDAQDALSTLHVIGRMAVKLAPRILGKMFMGPVGWILTAADVLNAVQHIGRMATMPMVSKRNKDKATSNNPFSKKAKIKRAARLMKKFPSKGEVIEILQTTDQVFGVGICLGPIVGAVQDIAFGTYRTLLGQPVKLNPGLPEVMPWTATAQRMSKAMTLYTGAGHVTDDEELMVVTMASHYAQQELLTAQADWNPFDHIIDVDQTEVQAPWPTNPLSLEVIEEEGIPLENVIGWPHNSLPWAATTDIVNEYDAPARAWLKGNMQAHEHDWIGYAFGQTATETAFHALANVEGEEALSYDYTGQSKFASIMLERGLMLDDAQPAEKPKLLITWIEALEYQSIKPTLKNILAFCRDKQIRLLKNEEPYEIPEEI